MMIFKRIFRVVIKPKNFLSATLKNRCLNSHSLLTCFQPRNIWISSFSALSFTLAYVHNTREDSILLGKLFSAARDNTQNIEDILVTGLDVNRRHQLGWTALHVAVINRNHRAVKALLKAGVDVNMGDEYTEYQTVSAKKKLHPLQVVTSRESEFSDILSNRASFGNFTALHYAGLIGDMSIIQNLLDAGADASLENDSGHTASAYCHSNQCRDLLLQHEAISREKKSKIEADERRRFPLEERIRQKIIGQESAICAVAAAIRRKENGWYDEDHPLVMLFLGSSGIGKTELAKQVANYLHKKEKNNFLRFDMSEYQSKHEVSKFIGSPPGYVGHQEGGQLTKQLAESPKAVVLFDEIEKAHSDILTVLLQLFDEGRLTDGQGKTVECKEAIFIMTSNLASEQIAQHASNIRGDMRNKPDEEMNDKIEISKKFKDSIIKPILKKHFKRDEFLGRINEIVYFVPFSRSELSKLVSKQMQEWAERAMKKHKIELTWDHNVVDVLADGYDINYGARSIKHEVERQVVSKLALAHERCLIGQGSHVRLVAYLQSQQLDVTKQPSDLAGHTRAPVIKLQVLNKETKEHRYVDLQLDDVADYKLLL